MPSAWAGWKPKHDPPYTVGLTMDPINNDYSVVMAQAIQDDLKASPLIGKVLFAAHGSASEDVQEYQSFVQQGVDLIIDQPWSPPALLPAINAAGQAGIPTIASDASMGSQYSIDSIPTNQIARGAPAAILMKLIGGKGDIVEMHGEPSVSQDQQSFAAFKSVLSQCPNVHVVGELVGNFNPPTAKSAMLQFLATHPGPIAAVLQPGTGFAAIIQAFQQAGRPVPPIMDSPGSDGGFGYWINNTSYQDAADVWGPLEHADEMSHIALRMLNGQGAKINSIFEASALVTNSNLKDFASTEWTLNTPGYVDGPPSTWFWTSANLDQMFNHPELKLP